jgi:hypothetical protein
MSNIYVLGFEGFLALLLVIAILYCIRLDGRLKALRTGNARMLEAAKELQSSVIHAENAVTALRRSADAAGRELQSKIDEARAMANAPMLREPPREVMIDGPRDRDHRDRDNVRQPVDFSLRRRSVL